MTPFVNIHTHQIENDLNILSITNWFTTTASQRNNLNLFSAGIHPWFIDEVNVDIQFQETEQYASKANCIAIGECGLDKLKGPSIETQIQVFEKQIRLAILLNKPVIVHCVKAFDILNAIIKKYHHQTVFIIHGFNQNQQIAAQLLKQGAYLSFGKALLEENNQRLRLIFKQCPQNQIFIENDDSLCSINEIYQVASTIKKWELNMMKEIIFANYKTVFTHE